MSRTNPALVSAFRKHLLGEFGRHGDCDPWWWPVGPGESLVDWGLHQGEERQLDSLPERRDGSSYVRFLGSLGAKPGATWVISTRPSRLKSFRAAIGPLHTCLCNADILSDAHVTDLAKFRGAGPDSAKNDGMTPEMWELSVRCLHDEYTAARPSRILITREAKKWFRERNSLINASNPTREAWRRDISRHHLDAFLTQLEYHPNSVEVCFWRAPAAPAKWLAALSTLK